MPPAVQLLPEGATSAKGTNDYIVVDGIPIAPPSLGRDEAVLLDAGTAKSLESINSFKIKQRVDMLEALTQGCMEASNVYDIFDATTDKLIFVGVERSDDMMRCCERVKASNAKPFTP